MTPKIAIIIATYNGARWIAPCLKSVFKTSYENYGVIIIDNGSQDGSVNMARNFRGDYGQSARMIELKENTGFVGGNNAGIKYAMENGYDAVVLLNQDTEVEPDWLSELVKVAEPADVGIVQVMLLLGNERNLTNNAGNAMHYLGFGYVAHYREDADKWLNREPLEIGYASGAGMLIKSDILRVIASHCTQGRSNLTDVVDTDDKNNSIQRDRVGSIVAKPYGAAVQERTMAPQPLKGTMEPTLEPPSEARNDTDYLDPKFFAYHEDLDLCWRARLAGYKIMIAPKAVVYHYYQFNRNKKMFYWTERNRWAVLLQNYQLGTLLMLGPMLFVIELMMILYSTASGWLNYKLQSYVWIVRNMGAILSKRRQVQNMRRVSDKEIMRHMDARLEFSEVSNPLLKYIVSPVVEWYFKMVSGPPGADWNFGEGK